MRQRLSRFSEINPFVREAGNQRYDSWRNRQRIIYDHAYYYCYDGYAHMSIQNRVHDMTPGTLILVPPDTPHSFWVDAEEPGEVYYTHFDFFYREDSESLIHFYEHTDEYLSMFGSRPLMRQHVREQPVFEGGYSFPECLHMEPHHEMEFHFRNMVRIYQRQDPHYDLQLKVALLDLLYRVLHRTDRTHRYASSEQRLLVEQMKDYVRCHYARELRVEEVVSISNLNPDYTSRIFHSITGVRLVEYIARYRISKAKELMLEPALSMNDILTQVGFTDENYFCRVVKKYEGKTPANLRRSLIATHIGREAEGDRPV